MANPYREDFITIRREDVEAHGRLTPDMRLAFGDCATCMQTFPIAVDAIEQPAYASVAELIASATRLAKEIANELAGAACPDCDAKLVLAQVAYHAWHAGLARDLVVRWEPNGTTTLFTWELGAELAPITGLAPADEQRLVRNAAFRADAMSLEVFLFLNDQEIASFRPGVEPKLAHLVFDVPGSKTLQLLLNDAIVPEGKEIALAPTDVLGIEVTHPSGRAPVRSPKRSSAKTSSGGPRFELTIDDEVVATFGNVGAGGLSFELTLFDQGEEVEVALVARGANEETWPLPLLCAGQTASIRVLGPGLIDEP